MKKNICVVSILIQFCGVAQANELLGHWEAGSLQVTSNGKYKFNEFEFHVASPKLQKFLACAKDKHSKQHVFISSHSGSQNQTGTPEVSSAFVCTGEINLSGCGVKNRLKVCK